MDDGAFTTVAEIWYASRYIYMYAYVYVHFLFNIYGSLSVGQQSFVINKIFGELFEMSIIIKILFSFIKLFF